jgi:hypothetical protein
MTGKEPIETRLEKLGRAIGSDENLVKSVMSRIESIEISRKNSVELKSPHTTMPGKLILNRFTKLAAAAAIVVGTVFGLKALMNELAKPAYALEQTLDACREKQQAHFTFVKDDKLLKAAWIEYGVDGNIAKVRVDMDINNGEPGMIIVWHNGHTSMLDVPRRFLQLFDDANYTARMLYFVNRYDPRQAVEYMQGLEQKGDVHIGIAQPQDRSKPIAVTINYEPNTFLLDSNFPQMREIMFVDQATKLVTAVEVWGPERDFEAKKREWELLGTYKYDGYDEPFEDGIFNIEEEAGADVNIVDWNKVGREVGLEFTESNLTEEQMAVETVRTYYELLIARNYDEAARLAGDYTEEKIIQRRETLEKAKFSVLEIVSIGKPYRPSRSWGVLIVPCVIKSAKEGRQGEVAVNVYVQQVFGQPNRRIVARFIEQSD